jgi:glutamate-5-semialdehyde dehydrogenase
MGKIIINGGVRMSEVKQKGAAAKHASYSLIGVTTEDKNEALKKIALQLIEDQVYIVAENAKDLELGKKAGLNESVLDRILLNEKRIQDMASAIGLLVELNDPIGETLESIEKDNGLIIQKRRVPIGVIGMIYEARPNVTIDAATLSLKTGNAVILRGSSSALYSNLALVTTIHRALEKTNIPKEAVQLIEDTSRETAKELFHLNEYLDVLIPRGGKNLIETVMREASVPVLETGAGNCHIYIDETAVYEMAERIVLNGKTQRPSVCNAIETVLIHEKWFENYGERLLKMLTEHTVEIYGDERVCSAFSTAKPATEEDWCTEYLALKVSVKIVGNVGEAIEHINKYGTRHSEAILTTNEVNASQFMSNVDAAAVYHNASTRFTDGFEFGYGAEIGISTQKLHARGPMGLPALTSSKFFIYGTGQVRG